MKATHKRVAFLLPPWLNKKTCYLAVERFTCMIPEPNNSFCFNCRLPHANTPSLLPTGQMDYLQKNKTFVYTPNLEGYAQVYIAYTRVRRNYSKHDTDNGKYQNKTFLLDIPRR